MYNLRGKKEWRHLAFFCFCLKPSCNSNSRSIHKLFNFWHSSSRNLNNPAYDLHPGFTHTVIFIPSYKGNSWSCVGVYRLCLTDICVTEHSDSFHLVATITVFSVQVLAVAVPHSYIYKASGTYLSVLPQSVLPCPCFHLTLHALGLKTIIYNLLMNIPSLMTTSTLLLHFILIWAAALDAQRSTLWYIHVGIQVHWKKHRLPWKVWMYFKLNA